MVDLKKIHEYWRVPSDGKNSASGYLDPIERSEYLYKVMKKYVDPSAKVLELGCNAGRNLYYLYGKGFRDLSGVDISHIAIDVLKVQYPELFGKGNRIACETVEDNVSKQKDSIFDVVFTFAVLMHIHPDSKWIFKEIKRITKKYLIIVEQFKTESSWRAFDKNYDKLFSPFKIVESKKVRGLKNMKNYELRVYKK